MAGASATSSGQPARRVSYAGRDHALDLLRTLAIIGMMAAHTARLVPFNARPEWARFVLLIEPLIPSLFLFLVGLSLVLSFNSARQRGEAPGGWYRRQLKRAGGLWLVSALFFTLELGARLPDVVLAGGILANIAYAIALTGGLIALPAMRAQRRDAWAVTGDRATTDAPGAAALALALGVGSVLFLGLDVTGTRVHPVNIGNSPFLPLWLFALAGALWGVLGKIATPPGVSHRAPLATPARTVLVIPLGLMGLAAGTVAVALIAHYGLDTLFTRPLGRSDASRLVPAPFYGGSPLNIGYYNLRPVLALACLGVHIAALALFGAAQSGLRRRAAARLRSRPALAGAGAKATRYLFALGRHALVVYILHLALLASLVVFAGARQPLKAGWQGTAVLLAVILVCETVAILRGRNKKVHIRH